MELSRTVSLFDVTKNYFCSCIAYIAFFNRIVATVCWTDLRLVMLYKHRILCMIFSCILPTTMPSPFMNNVANFKNEICRSSYNGQQPPSVIISSTFVDLIEFRSSLRSQSNGSLSFSMLLINLITDQGSLYAV